MADNTIKMSEVIKKIAERTKNTQRDTSAVLHEFKNIILEAIENKDRISWNGFFTLNYYTRKVAYRRGTELVKYDKPKVKISLCRAYRNTK